MRKNRKFIFHQSGIITLAFCCGLFLLTGCTTRPPQPERTQLEIRQFQTRSYDSREGQTKRIMKAVINVLQDEGYIVENADLELGFITARREIDVSDDWDMALSILSDGSQARYRKNAIISCSVNISEIGPKTRVRAVFQTKVLDNYGGISSVRQIDDPDHYEDFFAKVDKGIFLEKHDL